MWKRRSHCELDQVREIGRNAGEYCAQQDVYETDLTSNAIYGAETLGTTKRQENGINVNEMRMLRWMYGVTRKDNVAGTNTRKGQREWRRLPRKSLSECRTGKGM